MTVPAGWPTLVYTSPDGQLRFFCSASPVGCSSSPRKAAVHDPSCEQSASSALLAIEPEDNDNFEALADPEKVQGPFGGVAAEPGPVAPNPLPPPRDILTLHCHFTC
jgi:hypothetical protein